MTSFLDRSRGVLLAALLLSSSLALSFTPWLASKVSAVSGYDNTVHTTETLYTSMTNFYIGGSNKTCSQSSDLSTTLFDGIRTNDDLFIYGDLDMEAIRASLDEAYANGSYSVTQGFVRAPLGNGNGTMEYILLVWSESGDGALNFTGSTPTTTLNAAADDFQFLMIGNRPLAGYGSVNCNLVVTQNFSGYNFPNKVVSSEDQNQTTGNDGFYRETRQVFVTSGFDITYPPGYEGTPIPENELRRRINPSVGYTLFSDGRLFAMGLSTPPCLPVGLTETTGCVSNYRLIYSVSLEDEVLFEQTVDRTEPFNAVLPGYETYQLRVQFVLPSGPVPPISPDVIAMPVTFVLVFDGTGVDGGTIGNDCEVVGDVFVCEAADPYEDCSLLYNYVTIADTTFPLISIESLVCSVNNFGLWLRSTLISLFVPGYSFYQNWYQSITTFFESKLGFLGTSIGFLFNLLGAVVTGAVATSCIIAPPGEIFGTPLVINVCDLEGIIGSSAFTAMQVVIIGVTMVVLITAGVRKYFEVVDRR